MNTREAALYLRCSTTEQANEGVTIQAQEEKLQAYCKLAGIDIVAVIREEGVSGSKKLSTRPGGQELLALISREKVEHVIALKLDRLFRDAEDALHQTNEWDKAGIALHLVDMGGQTINTATAMGRFFLSMMAEFAELERNLIAERTAAAINFKKRNHQAYSPTPFGFTRQGDELLQDEQEQETLTKIHKMRDKGMSFQKIADRLNKQGIPSKTGARWYPSTVSYIIKNNLYGKEAAA